MGKVDDRWYRDEVGADGRIVKVSTSRHGIGKRWRAYFRDPTGRQVSRSFDRKGDAEKFLVQVKSAQLAGIYIDRARSEVTVGAFADQWFAAQTHWKPTTRERYAGILREHIRPRWGRYKLSGVTHGAVQTWVSELAVSRSPATVRKIHRVLSLILGAAVRDERIARNPATAISLPRVQSSDRRYLTHKQVHLLADACGQYRLSVLFLAYTGVRFGEMAALRVSRLDIQRRRATIAESVSVVRGVQTWGTPKGHERREVPIPRFLVDELAGHIVGRQPDDLVFPAEKGGALRSQVFQRAALSDAAESLGLGHIHPHALRHTAASLAIASGANVKVVQQMLGHKSATMTLDQYGHLFPDQLDVVGAALDAAARVARDPRAVRMLSNGQMAPHETTSTNEQTPQ